MAAVTRILYTFLYSLWLSRRIAVMLWTRADYRKDLGQRFGVYGRDLRDRLGAREGRRCWINAVSVGEVNAAAAFVDALRNAAPDVEVVVTTTTVEGAAIARRRLPDVRAVLYFPFDLPGCVRRAYRLIRPDFVVLMELELWPNHLRRAEVLGIPVFLVNARMPPRDARRYALVRRSFRPIIGRLALVCAQDDQDAAAFLRLGAQGDRVHVAGNMKFDASVGRAHGDGERFDPAELLRQVGVRAADPVLVAGSTHAPEEEILFEVLEALKTEHPDLFLVLAPRHPTRAPEIAASARRKGLRSVLRSRVGPARTPPAPRPDCLLVDTTGELRDLYATATVIFVGKSLVAGGGGQNFMEAAASGNPVVFGPDMENFAAAARRFAAAGAVVQVGGAAALRPALSRLLGDPRRRSQVASNAKRLIGEHLGAARRTADLVARALDDMERPARQGASGTVGSGNVVRLAGHACSPP